MFHRFFNSNTHSNVKRSIFLYVPYLSFLYFFFLQAKEIALKHVSVSHFNASETGEMLTHTRKRQEDKRNNLIGWSILFSCTVCDWKTLNVCVCSLMFVMCVHMRFIVGVSLQRWTITRELFHVSLSLSTRIASGCASFNCHCAAGCFQKQKTFKKRLNQTNEQMFSISFFALLAAEKKQKKVSPIFMFILVICTVWLKSHRRSNSNSKTYARFSIYSIFFLLQLLCLFCFVRCEREFILFCVDVATRRSLLSSQ